MSSSARSPEAVPAALAAAINAGDAAGALELWTKDAMIVAKDGSQLRGRSAIASLLESLVANRASMQTQLRMVHQTDCGALATGTLTVTTTDPAGKPNTQSSESVVVYLRDEGGAWRVAIDFPWGLPDPKALL
jgi:uncharacterized protein (TIGR02246 family)